MRTRTLAAALAALAVALTALAAALSVTVQVAYEVEGGVTVAVVKIVVAGASNTTYGVEVRGPDGQIVAVKEVTTNASGVAELTLRLPDSYPAGKYTVYVAGGGANATATFSIAWNATAPAGRGAAFAASNLVGVASRLSKLAHCRNEVLASSNVTKTEYAALFQSALNLTAAGDSYLKLANSSLAAGNYSAAFLYAKLAIQSYGRALELQEQIADKLNVSFAACKAVLAPPKKVAPQLPRNATCKWTPEFYPLMTAFNVTERRIEELERLVELAEEKGYNASGLKALLDQAEELVEEGRKLALACNISAAAHKLAEAKKILGAVNAALAKLGVERLARELRRAGIEVNETEVEELEKALKKGKIAEEVAKVANKTLSKLQKEIEKLEKGAAKAKGVEKEIEKRLEKIDKVLEKLSEKERAKLSKIIDELRGEMRKRGKAAAEAGVAGEVEERGGKASETVPKRSGRK